MLHFIYIYLYEGIVLKKKSLSLTIAIYVGVKILKKGKSPCHCMFLSLQPFLIDMYALGGAWLAPPSIHKRKRAQPGALMEKIV